MRYFSIGFLAYVIPVLWDVILIPNLNVSNGLGIAALIVGTIANISASMAMGVIIADWALEKTTRQQYDF